MGRLRAGKAGRSFSRMCSDGVTFVAVFSAPWAPLQSDVVHMGIYRKKSAQGNTELPILADPEVPTVI
jgi:hypothetical protein